MLGYLLVAAGAAIGAPLRYLTDRAVQSRHTGLLPWGTLTVNLAGSLILGVLTGATLAGSTGSNLHLLIGTGLCGTLTTYSTLSFETVALVQRREMFFAVANLLGTVLAGLGAALLGYTIGQVL